MYTIQANASGTRSLEVSEQSLSTIERYGLLEGLIDSHGIVDESTLEKLRLNVRSLMSADDGTDHHDLLDLCLALLYHDNMKAFGLSRLIELYTAWLHDKQAAEAATATDEENADIPQP